MRPGRQERLTSFIGRLAAEFLEWEIADGLLTVTRVELGDGGRRATIYVTVLPDRAAPAVMRAARRARRPLQKLLQTRLNAKHTPYLNIAIDPAR